VRIEDAQPIRGLGHVERLEKELRPDLSAVEIVKLLEIRSRVACALSSGRIRKNSMVNCTGVTPGLRRSTGMSPAAVRSALKAAFPDSSRNNALAPTMVASAAGITESKSLARCAVFPLKCSKMRSRIEVFSTQEAGMKLLVISALLPVSFVAALGVRVWTGVAPSLLDGQIVMEQASYCDLFVIETGQGWALARDETS
jgi:hypothetical protein